MFTTDEAAALGWTSDALRHAVHTGLIRRVRLGVYATNEVHPDPFVQRSARLLDEAIALSRSVGGVVLSHRSSALSAGLPVLSGELPCVTRAPKRGHLHPRAHIHRASIPTSHRLETPDYSVTTVARTIVDLAREHGIGEALVAGDAALRLDLLDRESVDAVLRDCRGWPGTRKAQTAVRLLDGRAESPLESLSRLALLTHGFDSLLIQPEIRDEFGRFVARADFYVEELGVVGEADGLGKYKEVRHLEYEQQRRQLIENLNLGFVRWQWSDLARFSTIAERIRHTGRNRRGRFLGSIRPSRALDW